jgi:hypothetical protein
MDYQKKSFQSSSVVWMLPLFRLPVKRSSAAVFFVSGIMDDLGL